MFKGKTVVVTGAAKGIGKAIALKFAEHGANIVLNYRSQEPSALINEIKEKNVKCIGIKADVGKFSQAKQLIDISKETFGTIDILVNNAGITKDGFIVRMSEDDFDTVIETNLKGVFNTIRHVSNIMIKQKSGTIINISSVIGITGNACQVNYSASKAGIIGITKSTARELAVKGITCNAIAPGFIDSDMTDKLPESVKEQFISNIPLKRVGSADEVADVAIFLGNSKYITGEVININGGMWM